VRVVEAFVNVPTFKETWLLIFGAVMGAALAGSAISMGGTRFIATILCCIGAIIVLLAGQWLAPSAAPPPPPPHPPVGMTREEFKKAQDEYVTKFDKFVKPREQIMVEAAKAAAEFGKVVVNYLVLGNVGGLGALVVLAQIMHDSDTIWITKQFWTAAAFACGAALAVIVAGVAHFNYASHASSYEMQAKRDDHWIRSVGFGFDENWRRATDVWMMDVQLKANRRANITNALSVLFVLLSASFWVYGAIKLAMSISGIAPH
jgi:hypothetical protein